MVDCYCSVRNASAVQNFVSLLKYCTFFLGIVGEMEDDEGVSNYYIWTHKKFDIGYNGKQIVDVNLTSENKVKLKLNAKIPFTYEVNWKKSSIRFEDRFDKYLDPNFFQHRVSTFYDFCVFGLID